MSDGGSMQFSQSDRIRILLEEYRRSQDMHNYYGRIVWQVAAIFIGGGLAALGLAASRENISREAVTILGGTFSFLMLIYYFLASRSSGMAEVHLARCREIEEELNMWQHRYAWEASHDIRGVEIPGEIKPIIVHEPSGWRLLKLLCWGLVSGSLFFVWFTAGWIYALVCLSTVSIVTWLILLSKYRKDP